jgi:hypothetical protein
LSSLIDRRRAGPPRRLVLEPVAPEQLPPRSSQGAGLRGLTFFSLAERNEAIALVMQRMKDRPMRNLGLSRRELFETIERDALVALPADDWEFAEWRRARVNLDYGETAGPLTPDPNPERERGRLPPKCPRSPWPRRC